MGLLRKKMTAPCQPYFKIASLTKPLRIRKITNVMGVNTAVK